MCDTTNVNSGIGKKGGSCHWYEQVTHSNCFMIMCRIHSQECIAGKALDQLDSALFGPSKCSDAGPSPSIASLKTLCFNLRMLGNFVDFWGDESVPDTFTWPDDFHPIDGDSYLSHMTDLQKLFCLLISKKQLKKSEVAKKFVAVGVRWLGFFCSLLHISLTMDVVLTKLQALKDADVPKNKKGIVDNTIRCLIVLKASPITTRLIYDFAKVHFICWRRAVTSTGETLFSTAVETSKMYAEAGIQAGLGDAYFTCINRHLYNADPVFLPLSTDRKHMSEVKTILQIGIQEGWQYRPAQFKDRLNYNFTRTQLSDLNITTFISMPAFVKKMYCSPLFKHLNATMVELYNMYAKEDVSVWQKISSLIPGHNQACERLIGDLRLSDDINTLLTISACRAERPRKKGNVNKS